MNSTDQVSEWVAVLENRIEAETHPWRRKKLEEIRDALPRLRDGLGCDESGKLIEAERTMTLADEIVERVSMGRDNALDILLERFDKLDATLAASPVPIETGKDWKRGELLGRLEDVLECLETNARHREGSKFAEGIRSAIITIRKDLGIRATPKEAP